MRLLLNLIWIVLGGFIICLEYLAVGILLCLTLIGIPFGVQCLKLAWLSLLPFGKEVYEDPEAVTTSATLRIVMNIIWLVVAGVWIFLSHVSLAAGFAITIIGIPFALQHLKLAVLSLAPFGTSIETIDSGGGDSSDANE